jgi:hypothetical protein
MKRIVDGTWNDEGQGNDNKNRPFGRPFRSWRGDAVTC